MSRSSSELRMIFGIVLCDLCNATERAMAVIPGTLAIVSKRGAAEFGEGTDLLSKAWHSEHVRCAKAKPASERLTSCVQPSPPRSEVTITLMDAISRPVHFIALYFPRRYFSVAIYAARSVAPVRDSPIFGIFGCGLSKKKAILEASKSGLCAIEANGGASLVGPRWFGATRWHDVHHRRARRLPLSGSAPYAGVITKVAAIARY
jgi:hypothetical protein